MKFLSKILFSYQLVINFNIMLGFSMVKFFNVKVDSIPIERGFFLTGIAWLINYVLLMVLLLLLIAWRFSSIFNALQQVQELEKKKIPRRMKLILKLSNKMGEILESFIKYCLTNYALLYSHCLIITLMITFLGYDILVHDLGASDKIFFGAGIVFVVSTAFSYLLVICFSNYFSNSFNKIYEKINFIRLENDERKIRKICELGILQLECTRKEITCGLFDLNWKHLFLLMSSFFSYLVMMIQFDYMLSSKQIKIM